MTIKTRLKKAEERLNVHKEWVFCLSDILTSPAYLESMNQHIEERNKEIEKYDKTR